MNKRKIKAMNKRKLKTTAIQIRVTPEEKEVLRKKAEAAHLTVSAYVLLNKLPLKTRDFNPVMKTALFIVFF